MKPPLKPIQHFKRRFHALSGQNLENYKDIDGRLQNYLQYSRFPDFDTLYENLRAENQAYQEFWDYLNINVTEFFRNPERFQDLKLKVFPQLPPPPLNLKIWSAGCSFGAEIYSLVMLMANQQRLHHCRFLGTDVDERALQQAQSALYKKEHLRNVPQSDLNYYFDWQPQSSAYLFKPQWRQRVKFQVHNLLTSEYPTQMDLIVCRNVMIYFTKENKYQIYRKFWASLKDNGFLFIGGAEQLLDINTLDYTLISPYLLQKQSKGS